MSRRVYRLNTTEYINQYLQQMDEWRRKREISQSKQTIAQMQRETQQLIAQLDTIAKNTELSKLPPASFVIDLESNIEVAKEISKLGKKAMKTERVFKPDEIPIATIIEDYLPPFRDRTEPISPEISSSIGHEIRLAVREKLRQLGFEGVDESAHIFRGAISVVQKDTKTDVVNVVAIGKNGDVYIGHPDKHAPEICDLVAERLRTELSQPIRIAITKGLKKVIKKGTRFQVLPEKIQLERESCG